jgi:basic membrane lipoprotein Med (substrate-binding protein (PBP1-ABC) superfamily)
VSDNLNEPGDYEQAGNAFGAEGYDLVINANASMVDVTNKLAAQYPDTYFGQVGLIDAPTANESAKLPELWAGSFVAGYLAGLINTSGQVGTIGGFEFPALTSEMEGFALGARYAKNDIKTQRTYINTWTDAAKAGAAATAMKAAGAEIIFSATDQATQGIFKVMGETPGHYVIPQYNDKHDQAPEVVLTSVLYGLDLITGGFVSDVACDTWTSESVMTSWGDGMALAPYYNLESVVPADVRAKVDEMKVALENGTIVLPGIDVLGVPDSADKVDLNSLKK